MIQRNKELWLALVCMFLITGVYAIVVVWYARVPEASGLFGHMLGIIGFILMLITEVAYSLRKRSLSAKWGPMTQWLEFHIFTGIVGPFMVLLHSSWKFQGLAGAVTLLTVVIVFSGFVGRYIYTIMPREVDEGQMKLMDGKIKALYTEMRRLNELNETDSSVTGLNETRKRFRNEKKALLKEVRSLANTRRLISIWQFLHIPLGLALFAAAFIHIGAAIYYVVLLK
jgi:uncharacterized membrane protein (DUF106 family)